ncbi:uncharacterized protein CANTADRAFT_219388 [Suhomyces tanzawaensis NRRL Y-17324]|uniref:Uncharacterized protein n=1 Tax=Suhomyces tanzawaensis NRRL Y-17324 TaxID=984487 RepID=A0A1E4SK90_9ASCO|nr:uncharacterized protein CANTADRAFT_219388 [Suhomyces tanzawaensis NRRL Y-17324]ODV79935.1 hypothetical protein CANTADRAFT_219388 [Suhomyces tanzawaensis NRRL Y-17324]
MQNNLRRTRARARFPGNEPRNALGTDRQPIPPRGSHSSPCSLLSCNRRRQSGWWRIHHLASRASWPRCARASSTTATLLISEVPRALATPHHHQRAPVFPISHVLVNRPPPFQNWSCRFRLRGNGSHRRFLDYDQNVDAITTLVLISLLGGLRSAPRLPTMPSQAHTSHCLVIRLVIRELPHANHPGTVVGPRQFSGAATQSWPLGCNCVQTWHSEGRNVPGSCRCFDECGYETLKDRDECSSLMARTLAHREPTASIGLLVS